MSEEAGLFVVVVIVVVVAILRPEEEAQRKKERESDGESESEKQAPPFIVANLSFSLGGDNANEEDEEETPFKNHPPSSSSELVGSRRLERAPDRADLPVLGEELVCVLRWLKFFWDDLGRFEVFFRGERNVFLFFSLSLRGMLLG